MTFQDYQTEQQKTAIYPGRFNNLSYPVLGLCGESGEIAEKYKKIIRDRAGVIGAHFKDDLLFKLGDVLWYVSEIASVLGINMEEIAAVDVAKSRDRQKRGKINGSGDYR